MMRIIEYQDKTNLMFLLRARYTIKPNNDIIIPENLKDWLDQQNIKYSTLYIKRTLTSKVTNIKMNYYHEMIEFENIDDSLLYKLKWSETG